MGSQQNLPPQTAQTSADRGSYLAAARHAFLDAAAHGPVTIAEAVLAAHLTPPPGVDLRALGCLVQRAEKAGEIQRVERVNGIRRSSHGAPVIRWVKAAP